ncbi:uncharacterized protein FPRO_15915 [Fusarium proliferatum ET1]|uniref:Uncharacterized protein n=1 Tax=Fusarium proliferatum (strain ET1) TaxID=1227346 RepID=A0A1L7WAF2_FUSPR|nr:uncharacterized protein FPRO_15915 [Fusarium proliferatum ET1]CZR49556.1 uncharacterized protein FPRO_15915 [Fusarium proliferatum ET1]
MSSDTRQRRSRSQAPSQQSEARILNQQNAIAEKTGRTPADLQGMFPTAKLKFWQDLKKLVDSHSERHGWVTIHEAIQAEVAQRQQGVQIKLKNSRVDANRLEQRQEERRCLVIALESTLCFAPSATLSPSPFAGLLLDTLDVEFYNKLEEEPGVGLCYNAGAKHYEEAEMNDEELPTGPDAVRVTVHGIAITLLWAQYAGRFSRLSSRAGTGCSGRRPHLSEESVDHRFDVASLNDQIRRANLVFPNDISRYPTPEEDDADMCQLPDVKILDAIAGDETTPPEFSFRPQVCYCQSRECTMGDYRGRMIVRGSSSTGPGDTRTGSSDDPKLTELLKCHTNYNQGTYHSGKVYFHQELRNSVADWGEVSVFMVGDTIFSMAMSRGVWTNPDDHHSSFTADRCLTNWSKINRGAQNATREEAYRKEAELRRFAIFQRQELLKRKPREFESLKVAVRLDIGISEFTKHGLFFGTNVARWPGADMLSAWQVGSQPYDSMFEAVGNKFALECGRLTEREEREERDGHEGHQEAEEGNDPNESDFTDPPTGLLSDND